VNESPLTRQHTGFGDCACEDCWPVEPEMPLADHDPGRHSGARTVMKHGTAYRYDLGCRCADCSAAKLAKRRAARARARAENRPSYQRELAASRARKARYRGTCAECGVATTGAGGPDSAPHLCHRCSVRAVGARLRGTGWLNSAILGQLAQGERSLRELAAVCPNRPSLAPALARLQKYGLVERVARGVYRLVDEEHPTGCEEARRGCADYAIELAAYNAGERPWPPCERCATAIPNAPFTGAMLCEDCRV
jgi:hypothetical protein